MRSEALQAFLISLKEDVIGFEDVSFEDINECSSIGENALHRAVMDENLDIAKELIQLGVNVNLAAKDDLSITPLHWAVKKGNHEIVELLLDNGADLFAIDELHGQPPFFSAMLHEQEDLIQLVLRKIFGVREKSLDPRIDESWIRFHQQYSSKLRERDS